MNDNHLIKKALDSLDLTLLPNGEKKLISKIAECSVEIFNLSGIQIFRNFKFIENCHYTLVDIFSYKWKELYDIEADGDKTFSQAFNRTLQGKDYALAKRRTFSIKDKFSSYKGTRYIEYVYFCPIFSKEDRSIAGVLFASRLHDNPLSSYSGRNKNLSLVFQLIRDLVIGIVSSGIYDAIKEHFLRRNQFTPKELQTN